MEQSKQLTMKKNNRWITILLVTGCVIGLALLLYPTVSNYWNERFTTHAVVDYVARLEEMDLTDYDALREQAEAYNTALRSAADPFHPGEQLSSDYQACLNISGDGIMGYLEIPKLQLILPVYHGTGDGVLQKAIGHLDWTTLPVGGEGTHCALSGHRGLVSAKLFTDLDLLCEGDIFTLNVLDQTLTYEVDQIRTVEPEAVFELVPEDDLDLCTLVTCTPYGINTHRLLVRGHRIDNLPGEVRVTSEAIRIDNLIVAAGIAAPVTLLFFLVVLIRKPKRINKNDLINS